MIKDKEKAIRQAQNFTLQMEQAPNLLVESEKLFKTLPCIHCNSVGTLTIHHEQQKTTYSRNTSYLCSNCNKKTEVTTEF